MPFIFEKTKQLFLIYNHLVQYLHSVSGVLVNWDVMEFNTWSAIINLYHWSF